MVSLLPVKEEIFAKCFTNKYLALGTGVRCRGKRKTPRELLPRGV